MARTKKRRLSDLYVVGKELIFDDGHGEPVAVWVQKLSPVDHETALRRANAARARTLSACRDQSSEEWGSIASDVLDQEHDSLLSYIVAEETLKRRASLEAELAAEEEWATDDYLQGLRDSWEDDELNVRYAENPEDPEAKRVFVELQRFSDTLTERIERTADDQRSEWEDRSLEQLQDEVIRRLTVTRAEMAWLQEYRRCETWLSVRDPDNHRERYFQSRDEVNELTVEVLAQLAAAYREISVEVMEGKASPEMDSSSKSSDASDEAETAISSGPQSAAA